MAMQTNPNYVNFGSNYLKIFMGGIPDKTTREEMYENFSSFGTIIDLVIIKDKKTNNSRGFGFVTFKEENAFEACLARKHLFYGREIELKRALPRDQNPKELLKRSQESRKLFIGGLPKDLTLQEFRAHFEKYGEIEDIVIIMDKATKEPRGFGFVTFYSFESLTEVLNDFKNHFFREKWVEVKMANSRFETENKSTPKSPSDENNNNVTPSTSKINQKNVKELSKSNAFETYIESISRNDEKDAKKHQNCSNFVNQSNQQKFPNAHFYSPQLKTIPFDYENMQLDKSRMQRIHSFDETNYYNSTVYNHNHPCNSCHRLCSSCCVDHQNVKHPPG